jgi:predicted NACHT family NTPase
MELPKDLQRRLREQEALDGTEWDEEALARLRSAYLDQSPRPMLEVLADPAQRKVVVLGDPGSGKSLLLQYLVLAWMRCLILRCGRRWRRRFTASLTPTRPRGSL